MARMSNIDYTIKEMRNWFEENLAYIWFAVVIIVFAIFIHKQANIDIQKAIEKENRINNIEKTLQNHTHYIDELEVDVHELKEQEVQDR